MAILMLRVVSPVDVSSSLGFFEAIQEGGRLSDSSRPVRKVQSSNYNGRRQRRKRQRWSLCSLFADSKYAHVGLEPEKSDNFPILSSLVANPAEEFAITSEQKVYDVVLKQAALVKKQLRSDTALDVKPDMVIPGTTTLLNEAYDRCGQVCAEYAKTYYLGTLLMTPERRRAIWAISGNR